MGTGAVNGIAKKLQKNYPNTIFVKTGRCLKHSSGPYIEGIVIEATPYKEHYYVWSFFNTVWSRLGLHDLSYSTRIAGGRYFTGSVDKVVEEVTAELKSNDTHLSRLVGPAIAPGRFLKALPFGIPPVEKHSNLLRKELLFDCAIAMLLDGELTQGKIFMESFLNLCPEEQHYLRLCARDILLALSTEDQSFNEVIFDMEKQGRFLNSINFFSL